MASECMHAYEVPTSIFFSFSLGVKSNNVLGMFSTLHSFYMSLRLRHPWSFHASHSLSLSLFSILFHFGRFCMQAQNKNSISKMSTPRVITLAHSIFGFGLSSTIKYLFIIGHFSSPLIAFQIYVTNHNLIMKLPMHLIIMCIILLPAIRFNFIFFFEFFVSHSMFSTEPP